MAYSEAYKSSSRISHGWSSRTKSRSRSRYRNRSRTHSPLLSPPQRHSNSSARHLSHNLYRRSESGNLKPSESVAKSVECVNPSPNRPSRVSAEKERKARSATKRRRSDDNSPPMMKRVMSLQPKNQSHKKEKKKKKKKNKDDVIERVYEVLDVFRPSKSSSKSFKRKSRDTDETEENSLSTRPAPRVASNPYYKPVSAQSSSMNRKFIKCRICHSFYPERREDANLHIANHRDQAFWVKVPSDVWYFDIEEVVAHFARMDFSKTELRKKMNEMNLVEYPRLLLGFSCSKCPPADPALNCSTEAEFKDHMKNTCHVKKTEMEDYRISWCRGCHTRFCSRDDLLIHVEASQRVRCFPGRRIMDRVFSTAHSAEFQLPPLIELKQEFPPPPSSNTGDSASNNITIKRETREQISPTSSSVQTRNYNSNSSVGLVSENYNVYSDLQDPVSTIHSFLSASNDVTYSFPSAPGGALPSFLSGPRDSNFQSLPLDTDFLRHIIQTAQAGQVPGQFGGGDPSSLLFPPQGVSALAAGMTRDVKVPRMTPESPIVETIDDDDDCSEVEELVNFEACRLSQCNWNGNHESSCRRKEISEKCGKGICREDDLHQNYAFKGNPTQLCSKLSFYVNYTQDKSTKKLTLSDYKVPRIPLNKDEAEEIDFFSNVLVDPRRGAGARYPILPREFPEKMTRFGNNTSKFVLATWNSRLAKEKLAKKLVPCKALY